MVTTDSKADSKTNKRKFWRFKRKKAKDKAAAAVVVEQAPPKQPVNPNDEKKPSFQAPAEKTKATTKNGSSSVRDGSKSLDQKLEMTKLQRSWLCNTTFFKNTSDWAFETVDADGSGEVDEKELYSGLLLIHLKLGAYAGPAACKPLDREKCHAVFQKMDQDGSGTLDKEEFEAVMMVLFGNVMFRVAFQYACTLMIVPLIAKSILDLILLGFRTIYELVSTLDDHSQLADAIEVSIEHVWKEAITFWGSKTPEFIRGMGNSVAEVIDLVPDSVWSTIPLTLISTVLSMMLIPWSLMKIDDYFQGLAERKGK